MLKLIASLLVLCCCTTAGATESYRMPKLDIGKGGQCVKDPQWMRKNHMHLLLHQRDETVHKGIRDEEYSLKNCIECHASTRDDSVIAPGMLLFDTAHGIPQPASAKVRWGMLIDTAQCKEGCNDCVNACNKENGLSGGTSASDSQWIRKIELKEHGSR